MTALLTGFHATPLPVYHSRQVFSSWPPELKAALKGAALRNHWSAEDWPLHITMCVNALIDGRATYSTLIVVYENWSPS